MSVINQINSCQSKQESQDTTYKCLYYIFENKLKQDIPGIGSKGFSNADLWTTIHDPADVEVDQVEDRK